MKKSRPFYGVLSIGKRPQHKPRKRYKDCIKNNLKKLAFNINNWEKMTLDRTGWKGQIRELSTLQRMSSGTQTLVGSGDFEWMITMDSTSVSRAGHVISVSERLAG